MSKLKNGRCGGTSLCSNSSKASHTPQPVHCHFTVEKRFNIIGDQIPFHLIVATCCPIYRGWLSLLKYRYFNFITTFKYMSTMRNVHLGMEIRAGTGLDPAVISEEEVVLQQPLHQLSRGRHYSGKCNQGQRLFLIR